LLYRLFKEVHGTNIGRVKETKGDDNLMGDIICKKCGAINPSITTEKVKEKKTKEGIIVKKIRIISEESRCALCGGEIDWIMS